MTQAQDTLVADQAKLAIVSIVEQQAQDALNIAKQAVQKDTEQVTADQAAVDAETAVPIVIPPASVTEPTTVAEVLTQIAAQANLTSGNVDTEEQVIEVLSAIEALAQKGMDILNTPSTVPVPTDEGTPVADTDPVVQEAATGTTSA